MENQNKDSPLADRIRPHSLDDFFGQEEIVGKNKLLRQAIESDRLPSMIFWGPPGSGKTTLAFIIAKQTKSEFYQTSAVSCGLKELKQVIDEAKENVKLGKKTIFFLDEIHRWNKRQQDALLPFVEKGSILLIGATTENPSFEVISPLLSRCQVFVFQPLNRKHISKIINKALKNKERGFGNLNIKIEKKIIEMVAQMSNGDARKALNVIEYAVLTSPHFEYFQLSRLPETGITGQARPKKKQNEIKITADIVKEAFQKSHLLYDKEGEEHYNIISALHKSMRGSDADASLYWLARMIEAGEDPLYIARRIIRFASEDIGLANSRALEQAVAAYQACHFIGVPECNLALAQAVVYMAKCKKSNELCFAYEKAADDVKEYGNLPVPLHLRNAPTRLMKDLGYGKDYKYSPDFNYQEKQEYFPEKLKRRKYFKN